MGLSFNIQKHMTVNNRNMCITFNRVSIAKNNIYNPPAYYYSKENCVTPKSEKYFEYQILM